MVTPVPHRYSQVLVERAAGECVGEVALIEDTPRTATLRAKESCVFMTMVRWPTHSTEWNARAILSVDSAPHCAAQLVCRMAFPLRT